MFATILLSVIFAISGVGGAPALTATTAAWTGHAWAADDGTDDGGYGEDAGESEEDARLMSDIASEDDQSKDVGAGDDGARDAYYRSKALSLFFATAAADDESDDQFERDMDDVDAIDTDPATIPVATSKGTIDVSDTLEASQVEHIVRYINGGGRYGVNLMNVRTEAGFFARVEKFRVPRFLRLVTLSEKVQAAKKKINRRTACRSAVKNSRRAKGGHASTAAQRRGRAADAAAGAAESDRQTSRAAAASTSALVKTARQCRQACVARSRLAQRKGKPKQSAKALKAAVACSNRGARNADKSAAKGGSGSGPGDASGDGAAKEPVASPVQCVAQQPAASTAGTTTSSTPPAQCQSAMGQMMQSIQQMMQAMQSQDANSTVAMAATPVPTAACTTADLLCVCQSKPQSAMCTQGQQFPSGITTAGGPTAPSSPVGASRDLGSDGTPISGLNGMARSATGSAISEGGGGGFGGGGGRGLQALSGSGGDSGSGAPTHVIQGQSGGGSGAARAAAGGGGGGSSGGGGRGRDPASERGFQLSSSLPRGRSRGLVGLSLPARDGMTAPLGPSLFEKISSRYQQQKKFMREER